MFYRLARLVNKFGTFILFSVFSWYLADFHSVTMPALSPHSSKLFRDPELLHLSQQSTQDKPRNQNKVIFRSTLKCWLFIVRSVWLDSKSRPFLAVSFLLVACLVPWLSVRDN